jgi:hypothetical protein
MSELDTRLTAIQQRRRREALVALVLLAVGTLLVCAALTVLFGEMYGVLALGVIALVLGVLIGLNN